MIGKLIDLSERMDKADTRLRQMASKQFSDVERARLTAKAEGVRLAKSYLDELIRQEQHEQFAREVSTRVDL